MARRLVMLLLSFSLVLAAGILPVANSFAQGEAKKDAQPPATEAPKTEAPKTEPPKTEPAKTAAPKTEAAPTEAPLPPIPKEVEAKLEAARKAVAEAIVAAQDAGLVDTSIDPPPILDILIEGRALDTRALKNPSAKKPYAVSPEVFGAWFTGYGKLEGINHAEDVRIINPSAGLKQWYDKRAGFLERYIAEIRKAKGPAPEPKKEEPKKEEPKPAETKPAETKKEEPKPAEASKEQPKPAEAKKVDEPKKN